MKKTILFLSCTLFLGMATPSFAGDNALSGVTSLAGSATATVIDVPEGMVVDGLWRSPMKCQHALAGIFGDEKGFQQNIVGAVIGIPFGVVWGVPTGALHGMRHGMSSGWEKPFSTESFVVSEEK